ncbi:MAG TPA: FecR domain-containing protein [Burkholderiales bacterium]
MAGTIDFVEGLARVEGKDRRVRTPAAGQTVLEGDTVTTLSDSEVHLQMADGALFMVRERTRVTITEYVADGGSGDRSLMDLAEGALRAITGWIGAYNRNSYRIRTPLVTIGVRGTDHEPTHIPIGDPRGQPGSYDKVNEGAAFMETKAGRVEVPRSRVVYLSASAKAPPRLLEATPKFFRAGRHEQRFVARSQEVRRTIPQRRFERQESVRRQGAKAGAPAMHGAVPGDAAAKARAADKWQDKADAAKRRPADKTQGNKARDGDWQKPAARTQADGRPPKDARAGQKPNRPERDERPARKPAQPKG